MESTRCKFKLGDPVVIMGENPGGNQRTPRYVRGKKGVIVDVHGVLENARDHRGLYSPLYTVRFDLCELSPCLDRDSICVDVHEEWLAIGHSSEPYPNVSR